MFDDLMFFLFLNARLIMDFHRFPVFFGKWDDHGASERNPEQ